jgi:hypothetical protein
MNKLKMIALFIQCRFRQVLYDTKDNNGFQLLGNYVKKEIYTYVTGPLAEIAMAVLICCMAFVMMPYLIIRAPIQYFRNRI